MHSIEKRKEKSVSESILERRIRDSGEDDDGTQVTKEMVAEAFAQLSIPQNFAQAIQIIDAYYHNYKFRRDDIAMIPNLLNYLFPEFCSDVEIRNKAAHSLSRILSDDDLYYILIYSNNLHERIYNNLPEEGALLLMTDFLYFDSRKRHHDSNFHAVFDFCMQHNFIQNIIELLNNLTPELLDRMDDLITVLSHYNSEEDIPLILPFVDKIVEIFLVSQNLDIIERLLRSIAKFQIEVQNYTKKYIQNEQLFNLLLSIPEEAISPLKAVFSYFGKIFEKVSEPLDAAHLQQLLEFTVKFINAENPFCGDACYLLSELLRNSRSDEQTFSLGLIKNGLFQHVIQISQEPLPFKVKKDIIDAVLAFIDVTRDVEAMEYMLNFGVLDCIEMAIDSMREYIPQFFDAFYRILEVAEANHQEDWINTIFDNDTFTELFYNYETDDEDEADILNMILNFDPYKDER